MQPKQSDDQNPGKLASKTTVSSSQSSSGPVITPACSSETPTSIDVSPGHTPNVVNVTVFNPASAWSAKNTPVFGMMHPPQLADHVPNGGVALKSKKSSSHKDSVLAVSCGEGVTAMNISVSSTSSMHVPSNTWVIASQPSPAMAGSMVSVVSSKQPSQSTVHSPEPSLGISTIGSPPEHTGVGQSKPASASLTAVMFNSSETTWM